MRLGVIDLGTNSVRFDIHELRRSPRGRARVKTLYREKLMVRLGQGVFERGRLDPAAVQRSLEAFRSFAATARQLGAQKMVAFGTSALREVSDRESFVKRIERATGIQIQVISGKEEARLIAQGILAREKKLPKGTFALIDIGGGSTEISICRGRECLHWESFPLGTARLSQVFLKERPPTAESIENLRRHVRAVLDVKLAPEDWPATPRGIGSSGTVRAVSRLLKKSGDGGAAKAFSRRALEGLVKTLAPLATTELLRVAGMEAKRVDMIVAGAVLLEECLGALGITKMSATEFSLRDGILAEEAVVFNRRKTSRIEFRLQDFYTKALSLGIARKHLTQGTELAAGLFDGLKSVHQLKDAWKPYLLAAVALHDCGEAISAVDYDRHSYYIVRNSDFPSLAPWEKEFIAELCLFHREEKVRLGDMKAAFTKEARHAQLKLLALLRIADALDKSKRSQTELRAVRVSRGRVELTLSGKSIELERLRIDQKKPLFERLFKRELVVRGSRTGNLR